MDAKLDFDASYVYQDVNHAIQHVHRSGLVHTGILSDPPRYLMKNVSTAILHLFNTIMLLVPKILNIAVIFGCLL